MEPMPQLSNRELDVVQLLLAGNSNKLIAAALHISDRTVEFHLKNIYEKLRVRSRVELVLKLRDTPAWLEAEKLGLSTVAGGHAGTDNSDRPSAWNWATHLREAVSLISQELHMKTFWNTNARREGNPQTFFGSIVVCLAKYADFEGRAARPEFWWFALFIVLATSALEYISMALASIFLIATLLPLLAVGARRLHDIGKSGLWQLFLLVPVGGIVILGIWWATPTSNSAESAAATPKV
jgi:DNA-binding CsgD family transcriptional regulator